MKTRFIIIYSSLLAIATVISIFVLTIQSSEVTFTSIIYCLHLFLHYLAFPFFSKKIGYQVLGYLLSPYLVCAIIWLFKRSALSDDQIHALRDLGYSQKIKDENGFVKFLDPEIKRHKNHLELRTLNLNITHDEAVKNNEKNEAILNIKIARTEKIVNRFTLFDKLLNRKRTLSLKFYYDLFSRVDADSYICPKPWHLYLGRTNENHAKVISMKECFSIGVFAQSNAGKTHLIKNLARILKTSTPDLEVYIFDAKLMDFDDTFVSEIGAVVFPMTNFDQINKAADFLEERKKIALTENMEIIRSHGFNHAEDCHTRSIKMPLKRAIYIFDEMGRYGKVKGSKEMKEASKRIVELAADYLAIMRAHSQAVLISTQRAHSDELDFDAFSNTQLLLLNGLSKEMSARYADSQVQPFAEKGKWYVRSDEFSGFIKTPFKLKKIT